MNEYNDDFIILSEDDEEFVDITSSDVGAKSHKKSRYASDNKPQKEPKNSNGKSKKAVIAVISVVLVVAVVIGVTCFSLFFTGQEYETNEQGEFIFSEEMSVSGLSIAGKTYEEAKSYLLSQQNTFIPSKNISVDINGEITQYTQSDFEYTFDTEEVLNQAMEDDKSAKDVEKTYEVTATPTDESVKVKVTELEKATNKNPKNARVSKFTPYAEKRFEYENEAAGCKLNSEDLNTQLKNELSSDSANSSITAKVETVAPKTTVDFLKKNIVKLSSYETYANNTQNAYTNMRLALEACNGSVIESGKTWSFNACTGNSNLESLGYKPANVIAEGQLQQGIGGGLCQSSSTIYNAGIRANMGIEERYPHLWCSTYVDTGFDATIDYPNLDLKMKNKSEYQMFMECKMVGTTLYVSIWGVHSGNYDEIKTANKLVSVGSSNYLVNAWRVYYKDGKEISREELNSSTYDIGHGLIFNEADINDTGAVDRSDSEMTEPATKPTQKPTQKPTEKPTQKPTTAPTEKPTEKPTEAPTETVPPVTEPVETEPTTETDTPAEAEVTE